MPSRCCVVGCNGNYENGPKVHVFSFPKNDELRLKWISAIQRKDFAPSIHSRVCERHFKETEILREVTAFDQKTGRTLSAPLKYPRLAPNSVPSCFIFPNVELRKHMQRRVKKEEEINNAVNKRSPVKKKRKANSDLENHIAEDTSSELPIIASVRSCSNEKWLLDELEDNETTTSFDEKSNSNEVLAGGVTGFDEKCDNGEFTWKPDSTRLLIEHFRCYKDLFKSGYVGNKDIWWRIALSMQQQGCLVTADMCEEKWYSLFSTYKEHTENNAAISQAAKKWSYYREFHELYWKKVVSMLDSQTKEMQNAGVQTVSESDHCNSTECELTCSSTSSSISTFSDCNDVSSSHCAQRDSNTAEKRDYSQLLQFLKQKRHSDIQWQLQMKELALRNITVQEQSNKVLNKLTELLVSHIQKH